MILLIIFTLCLLILCLGWAIIADRWKSIAQTLMKERDRARFEANSMKEFMLKEGWVVESHWEETAPQEATLHFYATHHDSETIQ